MGTIPRHCYVYEADKQLSLPNKNAEMLNPSRVECRTRHDDFAVRI